MVQAIRCRKVLFNNVLHITIFDIFVHRSQNHQIFSIIVRQLKIFLEWVWSTRKTWFRTRDLIENSYVGVIPRRWPSGDGNYGLFSTEVFVETSPEDDEPVSYDGARVYRATLRAPEDIVTVRNLFDVGAINSIWSLTPTRAEFLVRSEDSLRVVNVLKSKEINHTTLIDNVQRRINPDDVQSNLWTEQSLRVGHRLSWDKYPTVQIIDEYVKYLQDNFPSICDVSVIGYSTFNNPIKAIKISNGNPRNKIFVIIAGQHAREWVSITSALYIADEITNRFDHQPHYVKDVDWYIVPLMNPDGYEYSQSKDRLWRKNRRKFGICYGVDINRNFDIDWNVVGVSDTNVCSESYSGPTAFSESESKDLSEFLKSLPEIPSAFVDLHSYGQEILYPWCAKTKKTPNADLHKSTAAGLAKAIYKESQKVYKHGPAYHLMYPATGAALDWAYELGVNHSYAIETRDKGAHGFLLPPTLIRETGKELFQGVKYLASVLQPKYKKHDTSWL